MQQEPIEPAETRRRGDTIRIPGDYQWRAANSKNPVQRFWHYTKKTAICALCPPDRGALVLDVGCGSGVISAYLAGQFDARVIGFDGNLEAITFAKENFPEAEFRCALVDDELDVCEGVDFIYCLELIEHIYEKQAEVLLSNFHRLLKPGGKLFLTTPNYKSAWPLIEKVMDMLALAPPLAEEQHVTFYSPKSLRKLVAANGFEVQTLRTNCFLAPWLAPLSSQAAQWLDRKELEIRLPVGSIILLIATRR